MARGLTPRQEKFAQLYVELGNASEAYRQAGYDAKSDRVVESNSSRLLRNAEVSERIAELTKKAGKKREVTREKIIHELAGMAFADHTDESEAITARDKIKSLELLGKRFALWIEKHEHDGPKWREIFDRLPVEVQEQIVAALDAIDVPGGEDGGAR